MYFFTFLSYVPLLSSVLFNFEGLIPNFNFFKH